MRGVVEVRHGINYKGTGTYHENTILHGVRQRTNYDYL